MRSNWRARRARGVSGSWSAAWRAARSRWRPHSSSAASAISSTSTVRCCRRRTGCPASSMRAAAYRFSGPRSGDERPQGERFTMQRMICAILALSIGALASGAAADSDYHARVARVLKATPLIDGHNDLPWEIRDRYKSDLAAIDLSADTSRLSLRAGDSPLMTDIPRLRAG